MKPEIECPNASGYNRSQNVSIHYWLLEDTYADMIDIDWSILTKDLISCCKGQALSFVNFHEL